MDLLIDDITDDEFNEDERLPYWAKIWPSAIALSEYLSRHVLLNQKSVLELGCGLGLSGIVSSKLGANVLFSDYEQSALGFAKNNIELNNISTFRGQILDWRKPNIDCDFDIIIAADVLYEERFLEPVLNMLVRYLSSSGKAFIAEPNRNLAKAFFVELNKHGFTHKKFMQRIQYMETEHFISIYEIN